MLLSAANSLPGQPARGALQVRQIDSWVRAQHSVGQFDGAILVAVGGKTLYRTAFGEANREWHDSNTVDTRFRIGSITKAFTAILIMQLVERGELRLDAKVADYLPEFAPSFGPQVTVRQLLTHTSGLPDFNSFPDFFRQVQSGSLDEPAILDRIGQYKLLAPPGTKFSYSNDGYVVLGAIMAKVTGKSYEQSVLDRIAKPVRMNATVLSRFDSIIPRRASGYRRIIGGFQNVGPYFPDAAAGLLSTVDDLLRWDEALYGSTLLGQSSKALMWSLSPNGNAYGWLVSRRPAPGTANDSLLLIKGDGAIPGFYALTLRVPERHIFIVALTNYRGPKNYLPDLAQGIIDILLGESPGKPVRSLADILRRDVAQNSVLAVLTKYKTAERAGEKFEVDESHINSVGYLLLQNGRIDDAVSVFRFNVERFPRSANVYDSLGDALAAKGSRAEAIAAYSRALELNPNLKDSEQKLRRLQRPDTK